MKTPREVLSNNIYKYLKLNNMSQNELARQLGVASSTVSFWLNKEKYPRDDKLQKIADIFHISFTQLTEDYESEDFKNNSNAQHAEVNVPIIEKIKNKSSILSKDNIKDYRVILKHNAPTGTIFIFTQTNDDLKPSILKDDDLLIRVEDEVKLNSIVAVLDNEDILLRRVRKVGSMIFLTTNNEEVEPILYDENVKIIGTAIEVIRHFE